MSEENFFQKAASGTQMHLFEFTAGAAEGQKQLLRVHVSGEGPVPCSVHLGQMRRPCSKTRREIPCGEWGGGGEIGRYSWLGALSFSFLSPSKFIPALLPHSKFQARAPRAEWAAPRGAQGGFVWTAAEGSEGEWPPWLGVWTRTLFRPLHE